MSRESNKVSSPAATDSSSVNVDGATLEFFVEGRGTPVIVVGSSVYYPRTFPGSLRESCRIAYVDLRHFARNDGTVAADTVGPDTYVADIEKLRREIGFDRFILAGHSHHGNVALEYAKRYPQAVSHLVLIGSPPGNVRTTIEAAEQYWKSHASAERRAILAWNLAELESGRYRKNSVIESFVDRYVAEGPKYWFDPHYDAGWLWRDVPVCTDMLSRFRRFFDDYEFTWNPAHMYAPVLAVAGRHDYAVPPGLWEAALPKLPEMSLRLFEESGHTPQLEEPDRFSRVFLDWIEQNPNDIRE